MSNKIIGISGKLGSGKDYITNYLMNKIIDNYKIVPDHRKFADKVKEVTSLITNLPLEYMYTIHGKNIYVDVFQKTVGELQQIIGTEIFRSYDPDFWIKVTLNDIENEDNIYIIISDVRFKNEADYIKKHNGILIRINGDPKDIRKSSSRDLNHISETDLDDYPNFDIIYENKIGNPNINKLWNDVKKLLSK